ncbi:hypothetical protein C8J56DRAFT_1134304 [Mycena floridula]|nr:hypothetical protein C8J56DRAFT_1134304 [Mycena floridula]
MFGTTTHRRNTTFGPNRSSGRHFWQRKQGIRATLSNPTSTRHGRKNMMGRSSHVPLMTRVKRSLGIRPRRKHTLGLSH